MYGLVYCSDLIVYLNELDFNYRIDAYVAGCFKI